jgi:ligand-binding sensor domain-containing protein/DNA-binding CsgD family transcriptional regulator
VEDDKGLIWIGTSGIGLHSYNPKTKTVEHYLSKDANQLNSYEKSLCLDSKGNLWVGTCGSGLYQFSLKSKQFINYATWSEPAQKLSNNRVTDVELDSNQRVWVATDGGGLNYFDPLTNRFKAIIGSKQQYQSLNTNALYQMLFDQSGSLWVGTFNGGINVHSRNLSPFQMNEFSYENGALKSVLTIEEDEQNRIWLGTDGEGLLVAEPKKKSHQLFAAKVGNGNFPFQAITCIKKAGPDALWIGAFAGGLSFYNYRKNSFTNYQYNPNNTSSISHNNVWDIEVTKEGNLWIATLGGGLCSFDKNTKKFISYKPDKLDPNSISSVQLVDVLLDHSGKYLWAASEDKGLNKLNLETGKFKRYTQHQTPINKALSSNKLRCIFEDKNGLIWIGTEFNGLSILNPITETIRVINIENGLSSNVIHSIVQDKNGFIWITTQRGLHRIDPTNLNLIDFGSDENLSNNQYNPKSSYLLSNGNIMFGGTGGLSLVQPISEIQTFPNQKVLFSGLKVFNQAVSIGYSNNRTILPLNLNAANAIIHLEYSDKAIAVEFTTNDLANLNKKRFAYLLEGFERNWNLLNAGEHRAFFSSLAPGHYKLKVKVLNPNSQWSDEFTIPIWVNPPFWKTWWFVLFLILCSILLIIASIYYVLKQQKARYRLQADKSKQEILKLRNENLENEIQAKRAEQEILRLQNENLERNFQAEKREQEILKLKNDNLEKEVDSKKAEKEILHLRNQNLEREVEAKRTEQELLSLRNEKLSREVEAKQSRLSVSLLQSAHKNQFLNDLKNKIKKIELSAENQSEVRKVIREINNEINQEDYWDQFQFNFDEMHKDFVGKLKKMHAGISANDLRLCCFLRLELNNREIASILNITVNGVEQTKYRLKKKMQLEDKSSLNEYVINI